MRPEQISKEIKEEWRELGFYCAYDESSHRWVFIGSRAGLHNFHNLLIGYAQDPRNQRLSEHDHYTPYGYLKVTTWSKAIITSDAISGTIEDIKRLATIVQQHLSHSRAGDTFIIDNEYSAQNKSTLEFRVQENNFDPVTADASL